jgi:branched-chain amino acid transport system ATP-binding protein
MLVVEGLGASYGGIRALHGVDLVVPDGAMVALIGPNGAGKTTLLNVVSGVVPPGGGRVRLGGEDITGRTAHAVARLGLLHVPEGRRVLWPLSVLENLLLGRSAARGRAPGRLEAVFDLFPILAERRSQPAGSLSGGQQQMLAIGRALMGSPLMLLLDEPSLGLSPLMATAVFAALARLNTDGLPMLVVEQNARRALAATTGAYVLEGGRVVARGDSSALLHDPDIVAHYLGQKPRQAAILEGTPP